MVKKTPSLQHRARALLLALLLALVAGSAAATMIIPQDMRSMAAGSGMIVRATVLKIDSRWNADLTTIETDVWLAVAETFKGKASGQIVITVPGGRVDDLIANVVGAPKFSLDEDVIVFLAPRAEGGWRVFNLPLGKYKVSSDDEGNRWVSNAQYPLRDLLPGKSGELDGAGRMALGTFTAELARAAKGGGR